MDKHQSMFKHSNKHVEGLVQQSSFTKHL